MARILVIDDDLRVGTTFERQLRDTHHVVLANDARLALDLAAGWFDLYVLDDEIQGRKGVELCAQLRMAGLRAPVIITSGRNDARRLQAAREAGASGWLPRPSPRQEVLSTVATLLAARAARRRTSSYY